MRSVVLEKSPMAGIKAKAKQQELSIADLWRLWQMYAEGGYEKIDKMSFFHEARQTFESLFIPASGSSVLDAGCGAGQTFEAALEIIHPGKIIGADWSSSMIRKAEKTASKLIKPNLGYLEFAPVDLTKKLPWPNNYFGAVTSHLVIYYLGPPGWRHAVREFYRVTKSDGYLYISTLLAGSDLSALIKEKRWKLKTLFQWPFPLGFLALFYGLKLKRYPEMINEVLKREDVGYPDHTELISLLEDLGAKEFVEKDIFWGAGIALRVQVHKPSNMG